MGTTQSRSGKQAKTAQSVLVAWANEQESWVRGIVAAVLDGTSLTSPDAVSLCYERLLQEKGLGPGEAADVPALVSGADEAHDTRSLTLTKLLDVRGVNALAPDQVIDFGEKATILFGENGVGKTGYFRVLQEAAGARQVEQILPNVLASGSVSPHATIAFNHGGVAGECEWNGERGIQPLTRLDVFGSRATEIHVDDELAFRYVPSELNNFKRVQEVIERVRSTLQAARDSRAPGANPFPNKFSQGTPVRVVVDSLSATTDVSALRNLFNVSDTERAGLQAMRDNVASLQANASTAVLQISRLELSLCEDVVAGLDTFDLLDRPKYAEKLAILQAATATHDEVTKAAFNGSAIPQVMSKAWQHFIEAGHAYHQELLADPTLDETSTCSYCRQPLDDAARELVAKYEAYCAASRKPVDDARQQLGLECAACLSVGLSALATRVTAEVAKHPVDAVPAVLADLCEAVADLETTAAAIAGERELPQVGPSAKARRRRIDAHVGELRAKVSALASEGSSRAAALAVEQQKLMQLVDRLTLGDVLSDIIDYVEALAWVAAADRVLGTFRQLGTRLTAAMKDASAIVINSDFEKYFEAESNALRAPAVKLEFPGAKGTAIRKKSLGTGHALSDVLSEGEQRVIALADFLAEAALKPSATPIVLDDPVSSLDYRRLEHVAARIAEISRRRQVVVFTHNIWFAVELLRRLGTDAVYYDVHVTEAGRGVVATGSGPRTDSLRQLGAKINTRIQRARQQSAEELFESIEMIYDWMRTYCEVFVESEMLAGVTGRLQPNVMLTKLPQIRGERVAQATQVIMPIYERCCRQTPAHSQPLETLSVRPRLQDVESDWASISAARETYLAS